jgi:hypothetical protein
MRFVATLALLFGLLSTSAGAEIKRGGEGDWPLFCSLPAGGDYDAFMLEGDAASPNGYRLTFYSNGYPQSAVYPDVQDTEDGQFMRVYGMETYGLFGGRARHMLAYVAKTNARASEAGMKNTLTVVTPTFYTTDLAPSSCSELH